MGVNQMTGTPWHLERYTRKEGDERRHKSRCIYYRKQDNNCNHYLVKCRGSAHCPRYYEYVPKKKMPEEKSKQSITAKPKTLSDSKGRKLFPVGSLVRHKTFGIGEVIEISKGRIRLEFSEQGEKKLSLEECVKKDLLTREE